MRASGSRVPVAARSARLANRGEGPNLLGTIVDQRFRVVSHIGSGGTADVYEAEHVTLGRKLALKVLRHTQASNAALSRRFSREARVMSQIRSEHVVSVFDYGVLPEGFPFFVMDLLRGQTLRAVLEAERELNVTRVCNLAIDVCLGLHAAHMAGLVHRDLKPENLWLTRRDDGREACILLDFGVARHEGAHTTNEGTLIGTACYMSPEQIGTDTPPGPQSDIFALAVIAYECLAGVAPFSADSLERTLFRVLNEAPRPLPQLAAGVPEELWAVLERALHKQPAARFENALALASAVLPFAAPFRQLPGAHAATHSLELSDTLSEANADSVTSGVEHVSPGAKPAASRRALWGGALVAFGLGAGLSAWIFRPPPAPEAETRSLPRAPDASALTSTPGPLGAHAASAQPARAQEAAASSSTWHGAGAPGAASVTTPDLRRSKTAASGSLSRRGSAGGASSNPQPQAGSSSAVSMRSIPARTDPPQPRFDGTNPYQP